MRITRLIPSVSFALLAALAVSQPAQAALIAYWNFNNLSTTSGVPSNANVLSYAPDQGAASLSLTGGWATRSGATAPHGVSNFGGNTINAIVPDPAGSSLALQASNASTGTPNNGKFMLIQFTMTGLMDPVMTFAAQRTGTGFGPSTTPNIVETSTNGTTFSPFTTYLPTDGPSLYTIDFSTANALDNAATAYVRITFVGASGNSGNNRMDNIQINAPAIPEPATLGLLTALPLLTGRRRKSV